MLWSVMLWSVMLWSVMFRSVLRVVHILRSRKGLQGQVEEAVDEDEASAGSPHQQDGDEGGS